jgi:hypothetical protein
VVVIVAPHSTPDQVAQVAHPHVITIN